MLLVCYEEKLASPDLCRALFESMYSPNKLVYFRTLVVSYFVQFQISPRPWGSPRWSWGRRRSEFTGTARADTLHSEWIEVICGLQDISDVRSLLVKSKYCLNGYTPVTPTGLGIGAWGLMFLASKVVFSWPSVDRFGKNFGGLMTLGQVKKSIQNFC